MAEQGNFVPGESAEPEQLRLEPVLCPFCEQSTMPNLLADRSAVCSCPAERALPLALLHGTPWDGMPGAATAPMDAPPQPDRDAPALPEDRGQFGSGTTTEAYAPLPPPPGRRAT
ncbi:hypothetical protein JYK14_04360 [Siccirubricoccus sp. KC 17139]|uniref:Peptidoglycan-binding protein n=1 Tax=Siccirubricoccus soli TaxID=2899147 RepID=A0ABT1D338_9PROT|nr:hypothetical protein [Siccirubricoccus soli]MCO6415410.1 hypothetical protein [Siccirubricoccus soli]MCP2681542.1 hypothetical protein [Siccirubricoccus soli]